MSPTRDDQFMQQYVQNQGRIYRYILTLLARETDAEELFQATSLALWQHREEFDPARGTFTQWAFGYALNHVRNHVRKLARRGEGRYLDDTALDRVAAMQSRGDELHESRLTALGDCLDKLPGEQRKLIERYYDDTRSVPRLADDLGQSIESIYKRLQRIRRALLECINRTLRSGGAA